MILDEFCFQEWYSKELEDNSASKSDGKDPRNYYRVCNGGSVFLVVYGDRYICKTTECFNRCFMLGEEQSRYNIGVRYTKAEIKVNITVQMYPCSEGTDTGSPAL